MREREREAFFPDALNRASAARGGGGGQQLCGCGERHSPAGQVPRRSPAPCGLAFFWSDADTVPSQCPATVGPHFGEMAR